MFHKYQHIERLGTTEVSGILDGECYIFPKIDGTNGQVWLEDGQIKVGSRNREITPESDNAGCAKYILENHIFDEVLRIHPDWRIFFEWLVPHTIKYYKESAWRRPYVFDVGIYDENSDSFKYYNYHYYQPILNKYDNIEIIPPLGILMNPKENEIESLLDSNDYLCKDNQPGEGVVIKNYSFVNRFGRTTWAKVVRAEFKEKQHSTSKPKQSTEGVEKDIIDKYITKSLVEKEQAKIINECGDWSSKYIPRLLGTIWHTFIDEETFHFIKDFKNPTIDFKVLNRLCNEKIKEIIGI